MLYIIVCKLIACICFSAILTLIAVAIGYDSVDVILDNIVPILFMVIVIVLCICK